VKYVKNTVGNDVDTGGSNVDRIAILDCGGQYTKVIDRRIRELSVKSEIYPLGVDLEKIKDYHGIILSGGPASVWEDNSPSYSKNLFDLDLPFLGICYGMHLINQHFGGSVVPGLKREYGQTYIEVETDCPLFKGLERNQRVLMSHGDSVESLAEGFKVGAVSGNVVAAIYHASRPIFGVQFHPEVDLTLHGRQMLQTFVKKICGLRGNYILEDRIHTAIQKIRETVGDSEVLVLASGGVDSAVTAALLLRALNREQVYAIHVDHGFMRKDESDLICENLKELGLVHLRRVDAWKTFFNTQFEIEGKKFGPLVSVSDPEEKRQIIGNLFVRVLQDESIRLGIDFDNTYFAQGTLRPDLIESGNPLVSGYAHKIKTHHNDVQIIRQARERGMVIETNWDWHKDEVRQVARRLGIHEKIASRQPFPGPGLAIRYICHDGVSKVSEDQERLAQSVLGEMGYNGQLVSIKTVGVQGDARSYRYLTLLYGDAMDADWDAVVRVGTELPGRIEIVNRVAYVLNKRNIRARVSVHRMALTRDGIGLLRQIDAMVRELLEGPPISQVFAVLVPLGIEKQLSVAIRSFITNDYMTGRPAMIGTEIAPRVMRRLVKRIEKEFPQIDLVLYDVTGKPPATVEWE
jgi:GMP synthase (glutamine-hydrolysing)